GSTPGMLSVKVTEAPFAGRPSGSVTTAVRVTGEGRRDVRNWIDDADSVAVSLPEPRMRLITRSLALPAGSVLVRVIPFWPGSRASVSLNVPSGAALPVTDAPFSAFRATMTDRDWTSPWRSTVPALMVSPSWGELRMIFGLLVS